MGARFYYHRDHLGNVRAVSNASGNSVRWTDYFAYGAIRDEWSVQTGRDHYGFIGKELDRENSLNYFGARYFDAMTGVWNSVDPLWAKYPQFSPYVYAANNPLINFDPDGRSIWTKIVKVAVKVGNALVKGGNVASEVAGVFDDVQTLDDPNASTMDKVIAGVSLASELLPVSIGDVKEAKNAVEGIVSAASDAKKLTMQKMQKQLSKQKRLL